MKIENLKFKIVIPLFTICYLIFNIRDASAQALSISIDPPIIQIEATAPSLIKTPISIQNDSDQNITYSIFLSPFKAGSGSNGVPEFDNELVGDYRHIFERIKVLDEDRSLTEVSLAPKQKKDLTLSISVAKGEKPKDYYFSVIFVSQAFDESNKNTAVGARAGIGSNVLLSIGPKSQTEGYIEEFSAPKFVSSGPVKFKLNVANTSKHYITIKGNLVIKNFFGQIVGNIDFVPVNILAGSSRLIGSEDNQDSLEPRINWNEKFLLGAYRADLTLALSEEGPLLKKSLIILAFPAQAFLLILLAIALLVGIIKRARNNY